MRNMPFIPQPDGLYFQGTGWLRRDATKTVKMDRRPKKECPCFLQDLAHHAGVARGIVLQSMAVRSLKYTHSRQFCNIPSYMCKPQSEMKKSCHSQLMSLCQSHSWIEMSKVFKYFKGVIGQYYLHLSNLWCCCHKWWLVACIPTQNHKEPKTHHCHLLVPSSLWLHDFHYIHASCVHLKNIVTRII
jgi:hypothetical protein